MKEFAYNKPEYNLSDAFKKSTDSNNYKLLHINAESKAGIEQMFDDLNELLDIDKADGVHLDKAKSDRILPTAGTEKLLKSLLLYCNAIQVILSLNAAMSQARSFSMIFR